MEGETLEGEENTSVDWSGEVGLAIGEARRPGGERGGTTVGAGTEGAAGSKAVSEGEEQEAVWAATTGEEGLHGGSCTRIDLPLS